MRAGAVSAALAKSNFVQKLAGIDRTRGCLCAMFKTRMLQCRRHFTAYIKRSCKLTLALAEPYSDESWSGS
jgi:hypothetical protein